MAFIVVYDACVLHPAPLRDLLIRSARTGLFQAKWTSRILDECFRSIRSGRPELSPERLARTRQLMEQAIPDVAVTGYEDLIASITSMPDHDDRHVLAAAVHAGAQVIVTQNLRDFPREVLDRYRVEAQHPDEFILDLIDLNGPVMAEVVRSQALALSRPPQTLLEVLDTFREQGLQRSAARLRELLSATEP